MATSPRFSDPRTSHRIPAADRYVSRKSARPPSHDDTGQHSPARTTRYTTHDGRQTTCPTMIHRVRDEEIVVRPHAPRWGRVQKMRSTFAVISSTKIRPWPGRGRLPDRDNQRQPAGGIAPALGSADRVTAGQHQRVTHLRRLREVIVSTLTYPERPPMSSTSTQRPEASTLARYPVQSSPAPSGDGYWESLVRRSAVPLAEIVHAMPTRSRVTR